MRVRFWGVRGSTPTPQKENMGYGGNTSCIEIRTDSNQILIFDGGTGIRIPGQRTPAKSSATSRSTHTFFSAIFIWITSRAFLSSSRCTIRKTISRFISPAAATQTSSWTRSQA